MKDGTKIDEFKEYVYSLECTHCGPSIPRINHAILGICGESGELVDELKKAIIYGDKLNISSILEEAGDTLHYLTMLLNVLDVSFDEVIDMNVRKLKVRYPNGYSKDKALNRNIKEERKAIEGRT